MYYEQLKVEQIPRVLDLAAKFFEVTKWQMFVPEPDMEKCLTRVLNMPQSVVYVAWEGTNGRLDQAVAIIGIHLVPTSIADDTLVAQEFLWFVDPAHVGKAAAIKLYQKAERWAKESGAKIMVMSSSLHYRHMETSGIYRRLGYTPMEMMYAKEL